MSNDNAPSMLLVSARWVATGLAAAAFLAAAWLKLSGNPHTAVEFGKIGFGQNFRLITGVIEAGSALLFLYPRTMLIGALGLAGIDLGALIAQLGPLHGDIIHVIVLGGLILLALWLARRTA